MVYSEGIIIAHVCISQTPVQKWQTSDILSFRQDKPKHVFIDIGGAAPANLHFNAGSKDTAEEILTKLETSSALAKGGEIAHERASRVLRSVRHAVGIA